MNTSLQIVQEGDKYFLVLDGNIIHSEDDLFGAQWVQADYERRGAAAILDAKKST
jgi:hypothetical protein